MSKPYILHMKIMEKEMDEKLSSLTREDYYNCPNIARLIRMSVLNNKPVDYSLCDHPLKWQAPKRKTYSYKINEKDKLFKNIK